MGRLAECVHGHLDPQFWMDLIHISRVPGPTCCSFKMSEEWRLCLTLTTFVLINNTTTSVGALLR